MLAAIEAGGTKFVLAVGPSPDAITARHTIPTRDPATTLAEAAAWFGSHGPLAALGIGSFGPVELDRASPKWGFITTTPKPGWADTDVARHLAAALGGVVAPAQPFGQSRAGRVRQGDQPLLAALAADQQHGRIAAAAGGGQADQLADAHPRRVEQLHQAEMARPFRLAAPKPGGGGQKRRDLVLRQAAGQAMGAAGTRDADGRIVRAPALLQREAAELADRREAPRPRRPRQALRVAEGQVVLDHLARQAAERQVAPRQPVRQIAQVAPIGQKRVAGRAGLGRLRVQEGRDGRAVRHQNSCLTWGSSVICVSARFASS